MKDTPAEVISEPTERADTLTASRLYIYKVQTGGRVLIVKNCNL